MTKNLVVFSEVRSGSTFVAELLAYNAQNFLKTELWDLGREPFQQLNHHSTPEDVARILDSIWVNAEGFRCFALKCGQLSTILHVARGDPALLERVVGAQTWWLIVRRRNKIEQAVSLNCARCSGLFHTYQDTPPCEPCIGKPKDIQSALEMINLSDLFIDQAMKNLSNVMEVYYEDVVQDRIAFLNQYARFCLGIEALIPEGAELASPKLFQTFKARKRELVSAFQTYFLLNFHDTEPTEPHP